MGNFCFKFKLKCFNWAAWISPAECWWCSRDLPSGLAPQQPILDYNLQIATMKNGLSQRKLCLIKPTQTTTHALAISLGILVMHFAAVIVIALVIWFRSGKTKRIVQIKATMTTEEPCYQIALKLIRLWNIIAAKEYTFTLTLLCKSFVSVLIMRHLWETSGCKS